MSIIDTPDKLPSVDRLVNDPALDALLRQHGATLITQRARAVIADARARVLAGQSVEARDLLEDLRNDLARALRPSLRGVINLSCLLP